MQRLNRPKTGTLGSTAYEDDWGGSGGLAAQDLKVERAEVNIAGSGKGEFASESQVNANIAGSGDVTVHGHAACKVNAMGSGTLRCIGEDAAARTGARSEARE